jgi:hypothetical protein
MIPVDGSLVDAGVKPVVIVVVEPDGKGGI